MCLGHKTPLSSSNCVDNAFILNQNKTAIIHFCLLIHCFTMSKIEKTTEKTPTSETARFTRLAPTTNIKESASHHETLHGARQTHSPGNFEVSLMLDREILSNQCSNVVLPYVQLAVNRQPGYRQRTRRAALDAVDVIKYEK